MTEPRVVPVRTKFWTRRAPFPIRSFGNTLMGNCTRAKQAIAAMRMERIEVRQTPKIDDSEPIRVYREMSDRLYGGGDNGAYETDALSEWRKPEYTFKDTKGRALTIDAYLRINPFDHLELKASMFAAGAHGLPVCLNLPLAWQFAEPPEDWDIPSDWRTKSAYLPGSWGGHSMWAFEYDEIGVWIDHTWELPPQRITWPAAAIYLDEAHLVIDSMDYWRTKKPEAAKYLDLPGIRSAVNKVSSRKIA